MHVVRGDDVDPGAHRDLRERVVAVPVDRVAVVPELDEHPVAAEGVDEPVELDERADAGPSATSAAGTAPLRQPVSTRHESFAVLGRLPFTWTPARAASARPVSANRGAPFSPASWPSLMARASRACPTGPSASTTRWSPWGSASPFWGLRRAEGQLGAEDRGQRDRPGRQREADHPVEAVVVGDRQAREPETGGLVDELLGRAGAVEEREARVAVQLGVRQGLLRRSGRATTDRTTLARRRDADEHRGYDDFCYLTTHGRGPVRRTRSRSGSRSTAGRCTCCRAAATRRTGCATSAPPLGHGAGPRHDVRRDRTSTRPRDRRGRRARRLVYEKFQPRYTGSLDDWRERSLAVAIDLSVTAQS